LGGDLMDAVSLKLAKNYTNEKLNSLPSNQPTKTVSFDGGIYSVGNDVVNGQVSDVVLKGRTYTNILGSDGDFEVDSNADGVADNWSPYGTLSNKSLASGGVFGNKYQTFTVTGTATGVYKTISLVADHVYFISGYAKTTAGSTALRLYAGGTFKTIVGATDSTTFTRIKALYTADGTETTLRACSNTSNAMTIGFDGVQVVDLTAIGDNETNLDVLANKYPYVNGTKSTFPVTVKSVGNNLLDESGISNWEQYGSSSTLVWKTFKLEPNTEYTLWTDVQKLGVVHFNSAGSMTGDRRSTSNSAGEIFVIVDKYEIAGYKIMLNKVNTTLPAGTVLRSLPNGVKDEFNVTTGVKTQNTNKKVLQSSDITYQGDTSGYSWYFVAKEPDDILYGNVKASIENSLRYNLPGHTPVKDRSGATGAGCFCNYDTTCITVSFALGTTLEQARTALTGLSLNYQLAEPVTTKLPYQAPLQVYPNGTIYVEPIGDPTQSTLPTVDLTIPIGSSNKFGVTTKDYAGAAADWVLSADESKCALLIVSNAGANANIIAPDAPALFFVINNKTTKVITIKKSGGTGATIAASKTALVMHNGTDYMKITGEV
jgi:hypothetical protein